MRIRRDAGVALVLVLLVLATLVLIGTPFVYSMLLHERSAGQSLARRHAEVAATSARAHVVAQLMDTHATREVGVVQAPVVGTRHEKGGGAGSRSIPRAKFDGAGEICAPAVPPSAAVEQSVVDVRIDDEQGKVNINTASPALLGNLLGGSLLSAAIDEKYTTTEIPVSDTSPFRVDDDPDTVDGVVVILDPVTWAAEAISYRGKTATHLSGCARGEYFSRPTTHPAGSPIFDLRGYKVFLHRHGVGPGTEPRSFRTPSSIREIAEWSMVPFFLGDASSGDLDPGPLVACGLTPAMMIRAGLDQPLTGDGAAKGGARKKQRDQRSRKQLERAVATYEQIYKRPGMETFTAHDFEQIRDLITTTSSIPAEWSPEQPVLGEITHDPVTNAPVLGVAHPDVFSPGTLVRIRSLENPDKVEVRLAWNHARGGDAAKKSVMLRTPLDHKYAEGEAVVSALERHPIHINTAPRRVLEAVFLGLRLVTDPGWGVSNREARALADYVIANRPIHGFGHFRDLVENAAVKRIIRNDHVPAILTNAIQPSHPSLLGSTTGFCFVTGDVYAVETLGIVNHRVGGERARCHVREVIDVAPPGSLALAMASQDDWHFRVFTGPAPDWSRWDDPGATLPIAGRSGHLMISTPIPLQRRAFETPDMVAGSLKALTTEIVANDYTWREVVHFPLTIEGSHIPTDGPCVLETGAYRPANAGSIDVEDITTRPGCIEFWVRLAGDRSGDIVFFETLAEKKEPQRNRIRLYLDGDRQEIVFQIMDDAGPDLSRASGVRAAKGELVGAAEIRHKVTPATLANDTWYHLMAAWGSTAPGDQALYIDGHPAGKNRWVTRLSQDLDIDGGRVRVEDADIAARFPPAGTLLVGTEAIEYDEIRESMFVVRSARLRENRGSGRGVRGTVRQEHTRGTSVRLFGYSIDVGPSSPQVPLATSGNMILVGRGGARLKDDVRRSMRRDENRRVVPAVYPHTPGVPGFTSLSDVLECVENPTAFGFPDAGYLYVVRTATTLGATRVDWEYMKYTRIGSYQFQDLVRGMLGSAPMPDPPPASLVTIDIFGVSIETDVSDLDDRYPPSGIIEIDRGGDSSGASDSALDDVEWIHYGHIAERRFFIALAHLGQPFRGWTGEVRFAPGRPAVNGAETFNPNAISNHSAHQSISPVIRLARPFAGPDDLVHVGDTEGAPAKRRSEARPLRLRHVRETGRGVFASFHTPPVHNYWTEGNPKLRRFPSGELPMKRSGQITIGGPAEPDVGPGQRLDGWIDEIRLSRTGPAQLEITPFPLPGGKNLSFDPVPPLGGGIAESEKRVVRTTYSAAATVEQGAALDKLALFGLAALELAFDEKGRLLGRRWPAGRPREFGEQTGEGIFAVDGEAFHYTLSPASAGEDIIVRLAQDLPRDPRAVDRAADDDNAERSTTDPRRDLRAEVVPQITVADSPWASTYELPRRDGFLEFFDEVGREVIYYQHARGNILYNCLRGQLGTEVGAYVGRSRSGVLRVLKRQEIDLRTRSMLGTERRSDAMTRQSLLALPQIPVTRLAAAPTNTAIEVIDTRGFAPRDGYALVDDGDPRTADEILGYVDMEGATVLRRARDNESRRGLFRGRFGTGDDHKLVKDMAVVAFPARYHDHYEAEADSPDLGCWERACRMPGARWESVRWEVETQENTTFKNEVRVVVRFDGAPDWDAAPTNQPGGLYLFTDPKTPNRLDQEADLMELRVYFRYPPGSYGRRAAVSGGGEWNDDWKHSPVLDSLIVEYQKPWRVLYREELEY